MLPHLEGPCKALSLPGEHLFQASRILPDRMRPVIFHAFGKAKHDAPKVLDQLAQLGWETLPIALLGMPHYPASWVVDTWKPIGGCCYTGSPVALAGNSAFRFCLLMQWRAIIADPPQKPLGEGDQSDPEVVPVEAPTETNEEFLVRTLLQAATDQNSQESDRHCTQPAAQPTAGRPVPVCAMERRCTVSRNSRSAGRTPLQPSERDFACSCTAAGARAERISCCEWNDPAGHSRPT